ncbi:hypothetical protein [Modestobacter italicus]|uniref:hypothetical protein n=1 Tax=Modestobacter italicus (strain DSM 44449 / CECT 9708 / BC 501) TaxID=2732864 RepID=UPI001C9760AC|nr:hypothetical protein [Modestobacter italicus]
MDGETVDGETVDGVTADDGPPREGDGREPGVDAEGETSRGEYALGVLGALIVLLVLGFLAHQAVVVRDGDPQLSVTSATAEPVDDGWSVPFEVHNSGGTTAEEVQVTGVLERDGEELQEATATIAYVPPRSRQSGALLFSVDPGTGTLQVRPTAYTLP